MPHSKIHNFYADYFRTARRLSVCLYLLCTRDLKQVNPTADKLLTRLEHLCWSHDGNSFAGVLAELFLPQHSQVGKRDHTMKVRHDIEMYYYDNNHYK
ncbi:hypothetical protein E2C01_020780 [Portunus trituberculatus]|uniref:Uncharacterized protein n=1 Tax=Portunus trituberculatus TaxID=210409 RepID=A0A5B7E392_PORTR|nr:hypothetical protein [Portunus trituberculatus]